MYFDFDKNMNKKLLSILIRNCENVNCNVRAIVFDMGNKTLLKELGVNSKKLCYSFENPTDSARSVYIFPDVPHSVKNMKNHTLDNGMVIKHDDGSLIHITKALYARLLACDGVDFRLCHKVTPHHLQMTGMERRRVRQAMEFFSNSVAQALIQLFSNRFVQQARVIEIIDSWIDVMNSRTPTDGKINRCGLGISFVISTF